MKMMRKGFTIYDLRFTRAWFNARQSSIVNRKLLHDLLQAREHVAQHRDWRSRRVNAMDEFLAVEVQQGFGFAVVHLEPVANDRKVRVVQPVFLERAALEALDHRVK